MASVLRNTLSLLQSSNFADIRVKCGDFEWRVHRIILASGSKFFEKACGGRFKKASTRVITLQDDEPEMVARMLLCLYTSSYPAEFEERMFPECPTLTEFLKSGYPAFDFDHFQYETNPLLVHSKMYAIADKYDMPGVQAVCVKKFNIDYGYESGNLKNLVDALPHIYNSTPPSQTALREKAAMYVQKFSHKIMHDAELKSKLRSTCVQNGQLGWDVLHYQNLPKAWL